MENTDTEFYEKIDKRMAEILTPPPVSQEIHGQYDYNKDKVQADKGEDFVIGYLESVGFKFIRKSASDGDDKSELKEFDLLMSYKEREVKYEVKTDMYPKDTGNLVVEFECRGKPSGINVTKADYFTTYFTKIGEIWNIKTDKLKRLITENEFKSVPGGDDKKAKMYKIPREKFRKHFKVHKIAQGSI